MTYMKNRRNVVSGCTSAKKALPLLLTLVVFGSCATQSPVFDEDAWLEQVNAEDPAALYAPHRDEKGIFFNPWLARPVPSGRRFAFRKKMKFDDFPAEQYSPVDNSYDHLADPAVNSINFAGHASFVINIDGVTILTDPFFSNSALVVRKKIKIPFDFSKLPQRPIVLISHNHYDHLDKWTVKQLIKKDSIFVVPLGLKEFFIKKGAAEVYELDWWQSTTIGAISFTFLPAQHWSLRLGQKGGSTLWGGFLIKASKTIYFSGDSGYFCGFKEFGKQYNIDYALVGVGAYEPRWFMHYQHLNAAEFFRAAEDLNAQTVIPMHFGVISLSDEPLVYPLHEINMRLAESPDPRIKPLRVGEFIQWKP